jgi:hypothetical protein
MPIEHVDVKLCFDHVLDSATSTMTVDAVRRWNIGKKERIDCDFDLFCIFNSIVLFRLSGLVFFGISKSKKMFDVGLSQP